MTLPPAGKWVAMLSVNGKNLRDGLFEDEVTAAHAVLPPNSLLLHRPPCPSHAPSSRDTPRRVDNPKRSPLPRPAPKLSRSTTRRRGNTAGRQPTAGGPAPARSTSRLPPRCGPLTLMVIDRGYLFGFTAPTV